MSDPLSHPPDGPEGSDIFVRSQVLRGPRKQRSRRGTFAHLRTAVGFLNVTSQVIPRTILENAKGFAIFTVFKAGFLFSARAGSGIVVAKLPDGCTSPLFLLWIVNRMLTA